MFWYCLFKKLFSVFFSRIVIYKKPLKNLQKLYDDDVQLFVKTWDDMWPKMYVLETSLWNMWLYFFARMQCLKSWGNDFWNVFQEFIILLSQFYRSKICILKMINCSGNSCNITCLSSFLWFSFCRTASLSCYCIAKSVIAVVLGTFPVQRLLQD